MVISISEVARKIRYYPSINLAIPKAQPAAMAPIIITRKAPAIGEVPVSLLLK
jgi:hypothetical protein